MTLPKPSTKYCLFTELENGIWEFRFLKSTNEAVDEWVAWQNYLSQLPPRPEVTTVRTLLDFRPDGLISMLYALQKNADWRRQNPDVQPIPVKVALLLHPLMFIRGQRLECIVLSTLTPDPSPSGRGENNSNSVFRTSINGFQKSYAALIKEGVNVFGMRKVQLELFPDAYQQAVDWLLEN